MHLTRLANQRGPAARGKRICSQVDEVKLSLQIGKACPIALSVPWGKKSRLINPNSTRSGYCLPTACASLVGNRIERDVIGSTGYVYCRSCCGVEPVSPKKSVTTPNGLKVAETIKGKKTKGGLEDGIFCRGISA